MPPALGVTEQVVIDMNRWLSGDALLNPPIRADSDSGEWLDRLVDEGASQETALAASDELDNRRKALALLLAVLNDRERRFFEARRLAGGPDHARRTRRRVRRLARAPAPDRRELIREGTEGGEEPHRRDRNSVATAGALAPRGGRTCRRECSLSTARVHSLRLGQIHIASAALSVSHQPRFPVLALFGRRPQERVDFSAFRRPKTSTARDIEGAHAAGRCNLTASICCKVNDGNCLISRKYIHR
jgi:hypothetical protein